MKTFFTLNTPSRALGRRYAAASVLVLGLGLAASTLLVTSSEPSKPTNIPKPKLAISIKPRDVADALRSVIQADREIYSEIAAAHNAAAPLPLGADRTNTTSKLLPSPCELLRLGSQAVASRGVEFSYVLRSLQPVNPRNAPETDAETKGLQFVGGRRDLSYTAEELLGGRWYFTAVYPDVAVNRCCVDCHNELRKNVGQPLKVGDVLGGLVIRVALEL